MACVNNWLREIKLVLILKDNEFNKIASFFNMCTFLLTCAALVQPSWFRIKGLHCTQSLSLSQFFTFDNSVEYNIDQIDIQQDDSMLSTQFDMNGLPPCTTSEIITLMRILILFCFLVLLCSSIGVIVNLTTVNSRAIRFLRRNAVPSIMSVFWVIAIVGICYYTTVILDSENNNGNNNIQVDYEYGFYTITAAGALALLASAANLWGAPVSNEEDQQRRNLMEDWEGYEGPPPSVPALPPYTPSPGYTPSANPAFAPPELAANHYFPFHDLSVLPPPPPYTP